MNPLMPTSQVPAAVLPAVQVPPALPSASLLLQALLPSRLENRRPLFIGRRPAMQPDIMYTAAPVRTVRTRKSQL